MPFVLAVPEAGRAQEISASTVEAAATDTAALPEAIEEVLVTSKLVMRNRTEDENPVLSYDLEYFQRFEPVSVGEMLKRVPGVTFTSDVLEFDGVSMRGLAPGYTQILINGRRAPGGEADRSFFVDRIPAELVERIEIIRSPRADEPSEGIGGSLNIVLKEGARLEGGFVKAGALHNEDGKTRPSAALAYADNAGDTSYWTALNVQGRRNPKEKLSKRYEGDFGALDNIEKQDDIRDGLDVSANGELTQRLDNGRLRLSGLIVDTDRDEDERSLTFVDDGSGQFTALDEAEVQRERIDQQTVQLEADGEFALGDGELGLAAGWARFRDQTTAEVDAGDDLASLELDEHVETDITDDEWSATADYQRRLGAAKLKLGVDVLRKERDGAEVEFEIDEGVVGSADPAPGAVYTIEETRLDPFVRLGFALSEQITLDLGLRVETTQRKVRSDAGKDDDDASEWNPSLHLAYALTANDQLRASLARTVRRADYDLIVPYVQEEEPADGDDLIGNPQLANETALGVDLGYERRLGSAGVFGLNFFYRDISDLIELVNTGAPSSSGEGSVYAADNIGDGETWGMELDFSAPLAALQLPDTGLFFNYTWLDSAVRDPYTGRDRRFTNQPHHVYNLGFIHNVRVWDLSFGASYYDRDSGVESALDETVEVDYSADLEAFIEKRFGSRLVMRVAAINLLDKEKTERFQTYDGDNVEEILDNRRNGVVDESERESEQSGVLYQLTLRLAF